MLPFHETRFPTAVALGASGGPERMTEIVTLGSGREARNQRWAHSRRRFDAGSGVKSFAELAAVVAFFEERRGRFAGFRWKDRLDWTSCAPGAAIAPTDQPLGIGDGATAAFQLAKTYGAAFDPYVRIISKPVAGTVRVAVAGAEKAIGIDFTVDATTGVVTFLPGAIPAVGAAVTAGFEFDVPVRFDTDALDIDLASFEAGQVPRIPVVEVVA
jgi:uncharacterized protein (TIGR02217 family)